MILDPPPLKTVVASDGLASVTWGRWFQQLWNNLGRVQLESSGPCIVQGSGAPTVTLPNGSLYLRSDGAGPNLYVREGGAWVAK